MSNVSTPAAVRAFAVTNGTPVGSRGRFSADLIAAFNEANPTAPYGVGAKADPTHEVAYIKANTRGARLKRTVTLPTSAIRLLSGSTRGRIGASTLAAAGEAYAASL